MGTEYKLVPPACVSTYAVQYSTCINVWVQCVLPPCPAFVCSTTVSYTRSRDGQNSSADDAVDLLPNRSDAED